MGLSFVCEVRVDGVSRRRASEARPLMLTYPVDGICYTALNEWNVSNVEWMFNMFTNATSFNQPLNSWDVSNANVEEMGYMFDGATSFNQPLHAPWHRNQDIKRLEI